MRRRWEYGSAPSRPNSGQPSGSLTVPSLPPLTLPGNWQQLASFNSLKPVPVVMQVDTTMATGAAVNGPDFVGADFFVNVRVSPVTVPPDEWDDTDLQGALRVRYGSHGVLQSRILDPRSGSYQLPPCQSVVVEARGYNQHPTQVSPFEWVTTVSLVEGTTHDPMVPVVSGKADVAGGGATLIAVCFQGVRFIRFSPAFNTGLPTGDAQLAVTQVNQPYYIDMVGVPYIQSPTPDLVPASNGAPVAVAEVTVTGADDVEITQEQILSW